MLNISKHTFAGSYYVVPEYSTERVEYAIKNGDETDVILALHSNTHATFVSRHDAQNWADRETFSIRYYVYVLDSVDYTYLRARVHYVSTLPIDSI